MTRFFIGWKNGVGGVVKVMANDTDNPLTTPNTNYGAFLWNSENAEIGYGNHTTSQSFSPRLLTPGADYYYPQQTGAKFRATTADRLKQGYQFQSFYYGTAIWANRNAFHYMFEDVADYRHIWRMTQSDYPRSSDARTISCRSFPDIRITPYRSNEKFSIRGSSQNGGGASESDQGIIKFMGAESVGALPATYKVACYHLDLPVDNTAYPAVAQRAPVAGQKMVRIDPTTARMSKPGFHVDTATDAQCIFTSNKIPMKVIKTDVVTINAGATATIPVGRALANSTFIDYQVNRVGSDAWVPPWPDAGLSDIVAIRYRFSGTNLQLHNDGAVNCQVRYIVMAQDDLEPSIGTAKVFEAANGKIVLRRPGTAGSRLADTIIDSSLAYMPIVSQKYVPIGDFVASDTAQIGNRMHRITLSNPGGRWKPYVLAKLECRSRSDPTQFYYMDPYAKQLDNTDAFAASTFLIRISGDAMITFYCSTDNRNEDAYRSGFPAVWKTVHWGWEPVGLRYYIFAIPASL